MDINRTTINMADRKGVGLIVRHDDPLYDGRNTMEFRSINGCEAIYVMDGAGLHYKDGSVDDPLTDWPLWIGNEVELRDLLLVLPVSM